MALKLNDVITKVQNTKWTKINNFGINMSPTDVGFAGIIKWKINDTTFNDMLNIALISVDTPAYTNQEVAEYIGNSWRYHVGRDELFRFTLTFRDYNQMELYRTFITTYNKQKGQYFNRICFNLEIFLDEDKGTNNRKKLFTTQFAVLETVSQLQFSHNTDNQIAEFSAGFKCNTPDHSMLNIK
jgi:hypothetical protein